MGGMRNGASLIHRLCLIISAWMYRKKDKEKEKKEGKHLFTFGRNHCAVSFFGRNEPQ